MRAKSGSSPLARGLLKASIGRIGAGRIIPARAGFTRRYLPPRTFDNGSSPLARGLHAPSGQFTRPSRIIPARAGFTGGGLRSRLQSTDHPRSRGVYLPKWDRSAPTPGSSPLARGLQTSALIWRATKRIIPARAGFTRCRRAAGSSSTDHPRSRGVYSEKGTPVANPAGSSPLARGLPPAGTSSFRS